MSHQKGLELKVEAELDFKVDFGGSFCQGGTVGGLDIERMVSREIGEVVGSMVCLLYTSPSPRD